MQKWKIRYNPLNMKINTVTRECISNQITYQSNHTELIKHDDANGKHWLANHHTVVSGS